MRASLIFASALLAVAHTGAAAQSPAAGGPGTQAPPAASPSGASLDEVMADAAAPGVDVPLLRPDVYPSGRLEDGGRGRSGVLVGAGIGFVAGAGAAYAILHSGGSTSLCDRSANQDAMSRGECMGLTALGGLAGAAVGAVIGSRVSAGRGQALSIRYRGIAFSPLPTRGGGLALTLAF